MMFPVVSTAKWSDTYGLKVRSRKCFECKRKLITTIPFADKTGFGLISPLCECGSSGRISVEVLRDGRFTALLAQASLFVEPQLATNILPFSARNPKPETIGGE